MYYYGIDLGTTYSCIARIDDAGQLEVVKNLEGKYITPSVVEFISSDEVIVGDSAKSDINISPDNVEIFVKRSMGVHNKKKTHHGIEYTPEEISAKILEKLLKDAEKLTGDKLIDEDGKTFVITVPAYFGNDERKATENAAEIAGIKNVILINEPTAAAIAYGEKVSSNDDKIILVYDLGGGTFDVTVAEVTNGKVNVVCSEGNHSLGGKDWDAELRTYVITRFCEETGVEKRELYDDPEVFSQLTLKTEEAKIHLTQRNSASVSLSLGREKKAKIEISLDKFNEITSPHLNSTIELTKTAIKQAAEKKNSNGKSCDSFDEIILVGGSTRMRQVQEMITKEFGVKPQIYEPDQAVAFGAAIAARQYASKGNHGLHIFGDVTSKSYGIEAEINDVTKLSNVLLKNESLPASKTEIYYTIESGQSAVNINVYESNIVASVTDLSFGKKIAEGVLLLPPNLPSNSPLEVTFSIDKSGLLSILAKESTSGKVCNIVVKTDGLSESDITALKQKSKSIKISE